MALGSSVVCEQWVGWDGMRHDRTSQWPHTLLGHFFPHPTPLGLSLGPLLDFVIDINPQ